MNQFHFFFREGDRYKKTRRFCVISEFSFDVADEKGRLWEVYDTAELGVKEFTRCSMTRVFQDANDQEDEKDREVYLGYGHWSHCSDSAVKADSPSVVPTETESALLFTLHPQEEKRNTGSGSV